MKTFLFLFALLGSLVVAHPAGAHTRLTGTAPAAGDTVAAGVREVRLRFSAGPEASLTWLAVLRGADTLAVGFPAVVPGSDGREFTLSLGSPLTGGAYHVAWRTAGADGHVLRGSFHFSA